MNILVISYFFAGESNMGAIRIRRLVKSWVQAGDAVTVLTHDAGRVLPEAVATGAAMIPVRALDLPALADRLRGWRGPPATQTGAPTGLQGLRSKPSRLTGLAHRWLCVPDKYRPWFRPGLKAARRLLKKTRPDLLFVSIEPRTDALIAARLAEEFNLPLIVEYRDLWNGNPYRHAQAPTPLHNWLQQRMEAAVVRRATRLVGVTQGIADHLKARHGRDDVAVFTNFFDESEYPHPISSHRDPSAPFTIVYLGQLYGERDPYTFLEGLRRFIRGQKLTPSQVVFEWAGPVSGQGRVADWIRDHGLQPYIRYHGTLPHREALGLLQRAHVAIVLVAPGDTIHVPGKLFEAMGARTPVLLVAPEQSEALRILGHTNGGDCAMSDEGAIADTLKRLQVQIFQEKKGWKYVERGRAGYCSAVATGEYRTRL